MDYDDYGFIFGKNGRFKLGLEHWAVCSVCNTTKPWYRRLRLIPRRHVWFDENDLISYEWLAFFLADRRQKFTP